MTVAMAPVLMWRPVGDEEWRTLSEAPAVNAGFTEGVDVEFRASVEADALRVDDEPLVASLRHDHVWQWCPGFFAGEVRAELVRADHVVAACALDVSPSPGKLGRDMFASMVDELWTANPSLILGQEPATASIGHEGSLGDPWVAFVRLRRHAPDFLRALRAVSARPHRRLRRSRQDVPLHRVRHVDRTTAISALTSPAAVLLRGALDDEGAPGRDVRLDVPVVEETLDCASNRTMLVLARAVLRRAESLPAQLASLVDKEKASETRSALLPRWPVRRRVLIDIASELRPLLRRRPFDKVSRAEVTAAGLTAITSDPTYARAWTCGWRALRPGGDGSSERMWLKPTWEIYESWCFLQLGTMLTAQTGWDWRWSGDHRRLTGRRESRVTELLLQPTFNSSPAERPGFWSVSRQRVPDIVLRTDGGGMGARFLVFDAKYRTSREAVLDAMTSAHIYQDSLRLGARRPEASVLLVPAGGGAPWLEEAGFQQTHGVGVVVVRPGHPTMWPAVVPTLLER